MSGQSTSDRDTARLALDCLDLTLLDAEATPAAIAALCRAARTPWGQAAGVCVLPQHVVAARAALGPPAPGVPALVSTANFPTGQGTAAGVAREIAAARDAGAEEIDVVLPWRALLAGDRAHVEQLLAAARRAAAAPMRLKVIVESGALPSAAMVTEASRLALAAGAEFVKTSTGKGPPGATPEAASAIAEAIVECGDVAGIKISGGVRTLAEVGRYAALVGARLGAAALSPARFRIGASTLLGAIHGALATSPPAPGAPTSPARSGAAAPSGD